MLAPVHGAGTVDAAIPSGGMPPANASALASRAAGPPALSASVSPDAAS
jgi:hypothetical protein